MRIKRNMIVVTVLAVSCGAPEHTARSTSWAPCFFPLSEGNVWVYREVTLRGGKEEERIRVKTALIHREGVWALHDVDGDDYLFSSTAKGLLLYGEVKQNGKEISFDPPLEYVSPDLLRSGEVVLQHQAEGRTIKATARVLGLRPIRVPGFEAELEALVTHFEYATADARTFSIENWLVREIGPVARAFCLKNAEGREILAARLTLVAARINGTVYPDNAGALLAKSIFRHAFEHRGVWGADFPGFTANVSVVVDGRPAGEYSLAVAKSGHVSELAARGDAKDEGDWVRRTLHSMMDHRRGREFDLQHLGAEFTLGARHGPAVVIAVVGDAMGSRYEVLGGVIRTVSRLDEGGRRFKIEVKDVRWSEDARYLSTRFDVTLYDAEMNVREIHEVADEFAEIGGYKIPSHRRVTTGEKVREVRIEDIRLR